MSVFQIIKKSRISKFIPRPIKVLVSTIMQMLIYKNYDSSDYWRKRASCPGQNAVLWKNQEYNDFFRAEQIKILEPFINSLKPDSVILDIGCGIGIIASMISKMRQDVTIDAVDFEEMITNAIDRTVEQNINFIASTAEDFIGNGYHYNLIISSACFSMIRNIDNLKKSLENSAKLLASSGTIIMIDPFHRWNYLARAKFNTKDVVKHLRPFGLYLYKKSGVLFWPSRVYLANSNYSGTKLEIKYRRGEWFLKHLGQHFWADYKVLIFKKSL